MVWIVCAYVISGQDLPLVLPWWSFRSPAGGISLHDIYVTIPPLQISQKRMYLTPFEGFCLPISLKNKDTGYKVHDLIDWLRQDQLYQGTTNHIEFLDDNVIRGFLTEETASAGATQNYWPQGRR